eukprot:TRINITY_DN4580_c0_g1_i1.p1 TRINITY_DN4580_c0_g1~~TRINITY_DN4580_c0_g1_i1.p1  ORF type:complete len:360 (+),score=139.80 TRINITY_DN4580_c0_g1_i1:56-1081(+)
MASELYPEIARRSCLDLQVVDRLPAVVDDAAAAEVAASLDVEAVRSFGVSLAKDTDFTSFSCKFESDTQEAGLITLAHALDFGGGWRQELHAHHGKGAWLTVKPGIEALHSLCPQLRADWLAELSVGEVADAFKLGSEAVRPLAELLHKVCVEVGTQVRAAGHATLPEWVEARVGAHQGTGTPAALLVRDLVCAFPFTFCDKHDFRGRTVHFYKKAQLVVGELHHRFRDTDARYNFADGDRLTAFIDNVICATLRKLRVVRVTDELAERIDTHQPLPSGSEDEVALRAAAMSGVEAVVRAVAARGLQLSPVEYGNYLWGKQGKEPEFRAYTRHATKDTVFY